MVRMKHSLLTLDILGLALNHQHCWGCTGAVERKKTAFQTAALAALQKVLAALPGDHLGQVAPPLLAHIEQATAPSTTSASVCDPLPVTSLSMSL